MNIKDQSQRTIKPISLDKITQEMNGRVNDEVFEANIKAIKVSILNNKDEENVLSLIHI